MEDREKKKREMQIPSPLLLSCSVIPPKKTLPHTAANNGEATTENTNKRVVSSIYRPRGVVSGHATLHLPRPFSPRTLPSSFKSPALKSWKKVIFSVGECVDACARGVSVRAAFNCLPPYFGVSDCESLAKMNNGANYRGLRPASLRGPDSAAHWSVRIRPRRPRPRPRERRHRRTAGV